MKKQTSVRKKAKPKKSTLPRTGKEIKYYEQPTMYRYENEWLPKNLSDDKLNPGAPFLDPHLAASPEPFFTFGENLITLGNLLKDKRSSINEIVHVARKAGLQLAIGLLPIPQDEV